MEEKVNHDESHKQSKRYLVFYVIGLFSVALVLILLSYATQVRAEKQLNSMSDKLNQQASVAQSANQKLETLQATNEEQQKKLAEQEKLIGELQAAAGGTSRDTLAATVKSALDKSVAHDELNRALELYKAGDKAGAKEAAQHLQDTYGERIGSAAANSVLTGNDNQALYELKNDLKMKK